MDNWRIYLNTAVLCAGAVLIALPLGTILAVVIHRTDLPGRRLAGALLVCLLFLPLYVQVAGWEAAFGKLGWLTSLTKQPLLVGMPAVIFIHGMGAIPWVTLIVAIGLRLIRRTEEEVALLDASAPRVVAGVVLPQLAPFLLVASLAAAIMAAGDMTVTNIYLVAPGDRTIAEEVYMTLQSEPLAEAARQSLPAMLVTIVLVVGGVMAFAALAPLKDRFTEDRREPLVYSLGRWKSPASLLVWGLLALLVGLPLGSMAYKAGVFTATVDGTTVPSWSASKLASLPVVALWGVRRELGFTLLLAAAAATLDLALALLLAYRPRAQGAARWPLLALAASAWAIPGPIVALGLIALLNHNVPPLPWLYDRTDLAAVLAQGIHALPVVALLVWEALARFPRAPLEAAELDGAGWGATLVRVVLPLRMRGLAAAWLAGVAIASGDLAWSAPVSRPGTDTLPRRLFDLIHAGADDQVSAICVALCVLYAAVTAGLLLLVRERSAARRSQDGAA